MGLVAKETAMLATVPAKELHEVVVEHTNTLIDTVSYAREFLRKVAGHMDSLTDLTQLDTIPSIANELRARLWASINAPRVSGIFRASLMSTDRETVHCLMQVVPESNGQEP